MNTRIAPVLLALGLTIVTAGAQIVLNFDDVNSGSIITPMPGGYGGVNWPANVGIYGVPQPPYNPQSSTNRAAFNLNFETGVAESLLTFSGGPKILDGAYFSGYYNIQFKLYNGATLVASSSVL